LCSVQDARQVVSEVRRVLRPGGQFLLMEHGLSPEPSVARRQRRWNWLQCRLGDGCRLDLNVRSLLQEESFQAAHMRNEHLERTPKTHGYLHIGVAVK